MSEELIDHTDFHDLSLAICMAGDTPLEKADHVWKIDEDKLVSFGSISRSKSWLTMTQYVRYLKWYYNSESNE